MTVRQLAPGYRLLFVVVVVGLQSESPNMQGLVAIRAFYTDKDLEQHLEVSDGIRNTRLVHVISLNSTQIYGTWRHADDCLRCRLASLLAYAATRAFSPMAISAEISF